MNDWDRRRREYRNQEASRIVPLVVGGILLVIMFGLFANSCSKTQNTWDQSAVSWSNDTEVSADATAASAPNDRAVPWDYRIVEGTVGDLVGGDMTLLPDEALMPNDDNYATGDQIWTLEYMSAMMTTDADNRSSVTLSLWRPIKTFKSKDAADADIAKLKLSLKTELDLVGVYKTTYQGKTRDFAVLTLPSGQAIKQPIDEERYQKLKPLKKVEVNLEEVHDYSNYDLAYAKFRGWAA